MDINSIVETYVLLICKLSFCGATEQFPINVSQGQIALDYAGSILSSIGLCGLDIEFQRPYINGYQLLFL